MVEVRTYFGINKPIRSKYDLKCIVCGEPANSFSAGSDPVCLRAECKHVLGRKPYMNEKAFKQYFLLQSRQIKWNIKQVAIKKQILEAQREKEEKEYVACLMKKIKDAHGKDLSVYPYAMIPKNIRIICDLPEQRRDVFREFLSTVINDAFLELKNDKDNHTELVFPNEGIENAFPLEAQTCSVCRGVCCNTGEKNAYIKKETILRYMSGHPGQTPGHLLDEYMEHTGKKTFVNSCVYHTKTGCCLPRIMRSDTCNEFLCDTLIELDGLLNKTPMPKGVLLIKYAQKNWRNEIPGDENLLESTVYLLNNNRDEDER
jgi:hypothetical protein